MPPKIDDDTFKLLREDAFGGACSLPVIDAAFKANQLLNIGSDFYPEQKGFDLPALDESGSKILIDNCGIYISRTDKDSSEWIEIGVDQLNKADATYKLQNRLPIALLQDRSGTGRCSVAILDPQNPSTEQWVNSIIACKNDEAKPFDYDDGEIQYTAQLVAVLKNLIVNNFQEADIKEFIKEFKVLELSQLNLIVERDVEKENELQTEQQVVIDDPETYLYMKLTNYLGKMAVGDSITLQEQINESHTLTSSHILRTLLSKSETGGQINWQILFGLPNNIKGIREILPTVVLSETDGKDQPLFINTDPNGNGELNSDQSTEIREIAKIEGYREIFSLPEGIPNPDIFINSMNGEAYDFILPNNINDAARQLANYIASIHVDGVINHKNVAKLEITIHNFKNKFENQIDILDIGKIVLPRVGEQDYRTFMSVASGIKADITAPGWIVLWNSEDCFGVIVRNAQQAFYGSKNLKNCQVINSTYAFIESKDIEDCYVEGASDAFYNCKNIKGSIAKDCKTAYLNSIFIEDSKALSCDKAFSISYRKYLELKKGMEIFSDCEAINCGNSYFVDDVKKSITRRFRRDFVKNSIWVPYDLNKTRRAKMIGKKP